MRSLALVLAMAAPLVGQSVTLPSPPPLAGDNSVPFASGIGRYQQWFSPAQLLSNFGPAPIRIDQIQILAGSSTTITTTVDVELAIAHAPSFGLIGLFDSNFASTREVVVPRRNVNITAAGPGGTCMTFDFVQPFTWDGQRAIVVEARIFGNGRGNTNFLDDLRITSAGFGMTTRCYQNGNANATSGIVTSGMGLFMRFRLRPGAMSHYGAGCRGFNFITPTCTTLGLATPGAVWTHQIDSAAAQTFAALIIGTSNTLWVTPTGPIALPFDLSQSPLGSMAAGCSLLTNPALTFWTTTVGGPGAATAQVPLQVPPLTDFVGVSLFSQWLVIDPSAVNGFMSATDGIWSIVTPVGG